MTAYKSLLHQMSQTTPTDFWNDSCSVQELTYALENGAVGATTNPPIVYTVLKKELNLWKDRVMQIINDNPTWSEVEITWKVSRTGSQWRKNVDAGLRARERYEGPPVHPDKPAVLS